MTISKHFWLLALSVMISLAGGHSQTRQESDDEVLDFEDHFGAVPFDRSRGVLSANTALLSTALQDYGSRRVIRIPENRTYYLEHGVRAESIHDAVLQIDGTLHFVRTYEETNDDHSWDLLRPSPCLLFVHSYNITITSNNLGVIDGGGPEWWALPGVGFLQTVEHRPILLQVNGTQQVLVENLLLRDAPIYTLSLRNVNQATVRHVSILNRRTKNDGHNLLDLSAFNTDGIDISGHNVHVHDVTIWNQDDCIAVKDNYYGNHVSSNMTFERINASGLGLVIGSIGGSTVRNITFRDAYLHRSFKGIYLKFRKDNLTKWGRPGLIEDILFENITMEAPEQWGIWIGPAQQADSRNLCAAHPCSLCWPYVPGAKCHGEPLSKYKNITLRNVVINNPRGSPGVILGDPKNEIDGVIFDNVVVTHSDMFRRSRLEAFPMLQQETAFSSIHDPYVRRWLILTRLAMVGVVVVITAAVSVCIRRRRYRIYQQVPSSAQADPNADLNEEDGVEETVELEVPAAERRQSRKVKWAILLVIPLFLLVSYEVRVNRGLKNHDRYFVCRGVANGVAAGRTWPVPYCFDDQT